MHILFKILVLLAPISSHALPAPGLELNPKLNFKAGGEPRQTARGFQQTFSKDGWEVSLKGTRFADAQVARQMVAVEFNNINRLYSTRGNPYEGQISELIECSPKYNPQVFQFDVAGNVVQALVAGASERKLFGACSREQVGYWASYFSFYYPQGGMVIEGRLFKKADKPSVAQLKKLTADVKNAVQNLLIEVPAEKK